MNDLNYLSKDQKVNQQYKIKQDLYTYPKPLMNQLQRDSINPMQKRTKIKETQVLKMNHIKKKNLLILIGLLREKIFLVQILNQPKLKTPYCSKR